MQDDDNGVFITGYYLKDYFYNKENADEQTKDDPV